MVGHAKGTASDMKGGIGIVENQQFQFIMDLKGGYQTRMEFKEIRPGDYLQIK